MGYELMGRVHAALLSLRDRSGQGTVEYVGLILLLAVVLAGVVKAAHGYSDDKSIAKTVVEKLKDAIGGVGGTTKG
jgi:Flp pilus assembly protein TadG